MLCLPTLTNFYDILAAMTTRSYNQYCGLAYALDLVGERWTLLIIRELMAGPRRFTDLFHGLPGISTNLLTERLKNLEQYELIHRRTLPPPAATTVYELTPLGRSLETVLIEMGKWGNQFIPPVRGKASLLHASSYALTLKTNFRAEQAYGLDETYQLHIDNEVLHVHVLDGTLSVQQGEARSADLRIYTSIDTYVALLMGQYDHEHALRSGLLRIEGELELLERFIQLCSSTEEEVNEYL